MPTPSSVLQRAMTRVVRIGTPIPGLRVVLLSPVVARPGYWFASLAGLVWGGILSRGRLALAGRPF